MELPMRLLAKSQKALTKQTLRKNNNPAPSVPKPLDFNLVLKQGSKGQEVAKLHLDGILVPMGVF
jgi:hypothetical protein